MIKNTPNIAVLYKRYITSFKSTFHYSQSVHEPVKNKSKTIPETTGLRIIAISVPNLFN